ncbi:tetratricopeptide repeat protein [Flagellimonas pacifica]|uniref:tetratricopeptide repeat protein n=1 Tax=Flagellimonas pacifica TaxID=1247520 RepID=UPI0013FD861E|nr:tetratricopeptide repeat protein [Allomuricauda parva]
MSCIGILTLIYITFSNYYSNNGHSQNNDIIQKGILLIDQGNYVGAEKHLETSLETFPSDNELHINLGIVKNLLGKTKKAEHHYRTACRLEKSKSSSLCAYANFLALHKRYDEAERLLVRSIAISPKSKDPYLFLMEVYHREENWKQLSELARKVLTNNSSDLYAKKYLEISSNKTSILSIFEEEARTTPNAQNYLKLSKEYYYENLFAQSFHAVQQALKLEEQYTQAHYQMALIYEKLGNTKCAKASYRKATIPNTNLLLATNKQRELNPDS